MRTIDIHVVEAVEWRSEVDMEGRFGCVRTVLVMKQTQSACRVDASARHSRGLRATGDRPPIYVTLSVSILIKGAGSEDSVLKLAVLPTSCRGTGDATQGDAKARSPGFRFSRMYALQGCQS